MLRQNQPTAHLKDNEGRIKYSEVNWLELEAHAINKQLLDVIEKNYIADQRNRNDYIEAKNQQREAKAKAMTEADKVKLTTALETVSNYDL